MICKHLQEFLDENTKHKDYTSLEMAIHICCIHNYSIPLLMLLEFARDVPIDNPKRSYSNESS